MPLPALQTAILKPSANFTPALIKGIKIYPNQPLKFDFIIDRGDENHALSAANLKEEYKKFIKYFLTALTIPESEFWVNLSPYEKDRIMVDDFGRTSMGQELLTQDYLLKQVTASFMHPDQETGKSFWNSVYKTVYQKFGRTDIPVETFHKIWILPGKAVVYENGHTAFILKSSLKVMLEEDYLAKANHFTSAQVKKIKPADPQTTQIMREIIVPAIEHEVNYGKTFVHLRQIYQSVILAAWFKQNLKQSILGRVYVDRKKMGGGLDTHDRLLKERVYSQYLRLFKKGVYNFIREDYDSSTQMIVPRHYFSGGTNLAMTSILRTETNTTVNPIELEVERFNLLKAEGANRLDRMTFDLKPSRVDAAMLTEEERKLLGPEVENESWAYGEFVNREWHYVKQADFDSSRNVIFNPDTDQIAIRTKDGFVRDETLNRERRLKDKHLRRNPLNFVPIFTDNLTEFTGMTGAASLYWLSHASESVKEEIIEEGVARAAKFFKNTAGEVDEYVIDLADPIHPLLKPLARQITTRILKKIELGNVLVSFRLNDDNSQELENDFQEVVAQVPDKISNVFIAAKNKDDINKVRRRLALIQGAEHIGIMAFLSHKDSFANIGEIASAQGVTALVMGSSVAADFGIRRDFNESLWDRDLLRVQRAQALIAAHENRLQFIDHVTTSNMFVRGNHLRISEQARDAGADGIRALFPLQMQEAIQAFREQSKIRRSLALAKAKETLELMRKDHWEGEVRPGALTTREKEDFDAYITTLQKFQTDQLDGAGGMVWQGEWLDPHAVRLYMIVLTKAKNHGVLTDQQAVDFDKIVSLYGSEWQNQRLLFVPNQKVLAKGQADFQKNANLNFRDAKVVKVSVAEVHTNMDVFTSGELAYANGASNEQEKWLRLAARLAAKRAVVNALRSDRNFSKIIPKDIEELLKKIEVQREDRKPVIKFEQELLAQLEEAAKSKVIINVSLIHHAGFGAAIASRFVEKAPKSYGIDLVTAKDFQANIAKTVLFIARTFTFQEINDVRSKYSSSEDRAREFAVRYAFKEAIIKLFDGLNSNRKIVISQDSNGQYKAQVGLPQAPALFLRVLDFPSTQQGHIFVAVAEKQDAAMTRQQTSVDPKRYGGISLNTKNMVLDIKHDNSQISAGIPSLSTEDLAGIDGFVPVIISIVPAKEISI